MTEIQNGEFGVLLKYVFEVATGVSLKLSGRRSALVDKIYTLVMLE